MKKTFIILITTLLASSCSDNNETAKGYYNTGELKWETTKNKANGRLLGTEYFKNGNIKIRVSTLFINDSVSVLDGPYEEYYSDGTLKWKMIYNEGIPEFIKIDSNAISEIRNNSYIKFSDSPKVVRPNEYISLRANEMYSFRINLNNNIYLGQYAIFIKFDFDPVHYKVIDSIEPDADDYPYIITTPDRECEMEIVCVFDDMNEQLIIGQSPSVTFKVKVFTDKSPV